MLVLLCVITSASKRPANECAADSASIWYGKTASCVCKGDARCHGPAGLCWRASCDREKPACPTSGARHGYKPSACRGRCSCH